MQDFFYTVRISKKSFIAYDNNETMLLPIHLSLQPKPILQIEPD